MVGSGVSREMVAQTYVLHPKINTLRLISWNVRGLNSKIKRSIMFDYLARHKPHVILLQETHLQGSRVMALKRAKIAYALHSTYSSYARGTSILIAKSAPISIKHIKLDPNGCFVILVMELLGKPYTVTNIYVPPPFTKKIFEKVMGTILEIAEGPLIIAGDYNTVLDNSMDRFRCSTLPTMLLRSVLTQFDLVEAWRWRHANVREYSCQSDSHDTLSRIDLCLVSSDILHLIAGIKYLPRALSDHSPLMVDLALNTPSSYRVWRLSPLWLADQAGIDQTSADMKLYWVNNKHSADIPMVWDAFKATTHGSFAAAIGRAHKASQSRLVDAEGELRVAETAYSTGPTSETHTTWRHRARELDLVLLERTQKKLLYQTQRIFGQAELSTL